MVQMTNHKQCSHHVHRSHAPKDLGAVKPFQCFPVGKLKMPKTAIFAYIEFPYS